MKQIKDEPKRKQKNPTTNYAKDTHKQFCERCFGVEQGRSGHGKPAQKQHMHALNQKN